MSRWAEVSLGVIAIATLTTSIMQVAVLVAVVSLARRIGRAVERFEQEIKPAIGHINAIARDAARAASLATAQVERVDRVFSELVDGVEQAIGVLQGFMSGPLRKGGPLSSAMSAFWAVFSVIRNARAGRARSRADEEDALFI